MLDDYTRAHVNRAIEDALHPRGMSIHSGKVSIDAATLQRLVVMIDRSAEALLDAQERIAELERDAARYRWLRRDPSMLLHLRNSEFDAAIDRARGAA